MVIALLAEFRYRCGCKKQKRSAKLCQPQKALHRGHNEGNIRQRSDSRWEVRLSAGIDYNLHLLQHTARDHRNHAEASA